MSELTVTLVRMGLLALLWIFVFSIVGVVRTDIYGTRVSRRKSKPARDKSPAKAAKKAKAGGPAPTAVTPYEPAKPRKGEPRTLTVTDGPLAGTTFPLKPSGVLIGRNPECTLVVDDDFTSGRHARLSARPDGWYAEDLGSTNGTFVDNAKITAPTLLRVGSVLRVGRTVLELRG